MACFLIDALYQREDILNSSLEDLIKDDSQEIKFIFSFVKSYFKLADDRVLRKTINDKLIHLPGRTKAKKTKISENLPN